MDERTIGENVGIDVRCAFLSLVDGALNTPAESSRLGENDFHKMADGICVVGQVGTLDSMEKSVAGVVLVVSRKIRADSLLGILIDVLW